MEQFLNDLVLWLQQTLPLYWLVASIVIGLLLLTILALRTKKQVNALDKQRQELEIAKATNEQKIDTINRDFQALTTKSEESTEQVSKLIAESAKLKSSRDEKLEQLTANENERLGLREMLENNNRVISRLEGESLEQKARLNAEQEKLAELKTQFEEQKRQLKNEFKVVSEEIMKERQEMLSEQNKEGVGSLLKPLKDQIAGFQKRINEVHDEAIKGNTHLKSEIDNVMRLGIKMSDEASNLTTALKGKSQQRGAWGEAQLERTLELSGLIQHDHYEKQSSFVDDNGKRKQTDYIIKLPDEKCIIIDSKVSLNAYERACSTEGDEQTSAMKMHVAAVRTHINELAAKDYTNLSGIHSPDFVLMFMPIEPAYIEAMKEDPELFTYGYNKNIILVSHTTVIPILRTVANLWMLDKSNKEARSIGERANDIFNSVATVSERLEALGKALGTVSGHYNKTVTALSGNQGLQGKVKRFTELSSKANKSMPELEHKHHEFDVGKLAAERVAEPEQSQLLDSNEQSTDS